MHTTLFSIRETVSLIMTSTPTYILPWSRVLLEKLTDPQLIKTFPSFYGT